MAWSEVPFVLVLLSMSLPAQEANRSVSRSLRPPPTFEVSVVDDETGQPVRDVPIGVFLGTESEQGRRFLGDRSVGGRDIPVGLTDATGRCRVPFVGPEAVVTAGDGQRRGWRAVVGASLPTGPLTIVIRRLASMKIKVVDRDRRAIPNCPFMVFFDFPLYGIFDPDDGLCRMTDADGVAEIGPIPCPYPASPGGGGAATRPTPNVKPLLIFPTLFSPDFGRLRIDLPGVIELSPLATPEMVVELPSDRIVRARAEGAGTGRIEWKIVRSRFEASSRISRRHGRLVFQGESSSEGISIPVIGDGFVEVFAVSTTETASGHVLRDSNDPWLELPVTVSAIGVCLLSKRELQPPRDEFVGRMIDGSGPVANRHVTFDLVRFVDGVLERRKGWSFVTGPTGEFAFKRPDISGLVSMSDFDFIEFAWIEGAESRRECNYLPRRIDQVARRALGDIDLGRYECYVDVELDGAASDDVPAFEVVDPPSGFFGGVPAPYGTLSWARRPDAVNVYRVFLPPHASSFTLQAHASGKTSEPFRIGDDRAIPRIRLR